MGNAPVFALQAELRLLLLDDALVLGPQASQVAREYQGVAVQTRAIVVHVSARVVDGVVLIVGVNHPVVVVCKRERLNVRTKRGDVFLTAVFRE